VVLDYIIRNTDRGNDNWLIKYEKPQLVKKDTAEGGYKIRFFRGPLAAFSNVIVPKFEPITPWLLCI
jgi:hypothetical protein